MLREQDVIAGQAQDVPPGIVGVKPAELRRLAAEQARRRRAATREVRILAAEREERQEIQKDIAVGTSGEFGNGDLVAGGPDRRAVAKVVSKVDRAEKAASRTRDPRKPVLGEKRHINTEWDGSSYLLDGTPVTDAEFDLAWTEAPGREGTNVTPDVIEFGAYAVDPEVERFLNGEEVHEVTLEPGVPVDPFRTDSSHKEPEFDPDIMLTFHESAEGTSLDLLRERVSGNRYNGHFQQQVAVNAATQWDQTH